MVTGTSLIAFMATGGRRRKMIRMVAATPVAANIYQTTTCSMLNTVKYFVAYYPYFMDYDTEV